MSEKNNTRSRTLSLSRTFNAPISLVWEAWTQPEKIAQWWGPKGMKIEVVQHDFHVGGAWQYSMEMPEGSKFITEGVYIEIEKFKKIVSTADFKPMTEGIDIQAEFEENGNNTNFVFNVVHPTEEYCQQQK